MNEDCALRDDLLIVDGFAGGGGVSIAIRDALGQAVTIAFNHDLAAIRMHKANHPETEHYCDDAYDLWPPTVTGGRSPDVAWFSPDCTHFSRAAGKKPRSQKIRGLPWMVLTWARTVRPTVIFMENVDEIRSWGPLDGAGNPIATRKGETWRDLLSQLAHLGYAVEHQTLVAADYGAPTSRKRLFLVARCDGRPIQWPAKTHGPGRPRPWRAAAECIDWSLPIPSIFGRKKPLAAKTQMRIAEGIRRYVVESAKPFLLCLTHGGRLEPLVAPFLARVNSHGWDENGSDVREMTRPGWTVTGKNDVAVLAACWLDKLYGSARAGQPLTAPMPTITSGGGRGGGHAALCAAFFCQYYGSGGQWAGLSEPMRTIVSKARTGLVAVTFAGQEYALVDIGLRMLQPHELAKAHGLEMALLTGTKSEQVKRLGNSVPRHVAEALLRANLDRAPMAWAA